MLAMLGGWPKDATIAVVGHEPDLSALLAHLLGGAKCERLTFRKGGAALLELPGTPGQGGRLVWYLRPRVLRTLGRT
jgi:phosphohistidine phosphatase